MTMMLRGRYQIIQVLKTGGFGETFLAEDTYLPSHYRCVIKRLKPVTSNSQYQLLQHYFQRDGFEREAAIWQKLAEGSDQIPKLHAYFCEEEECYLVQEWIQGQTLTNKVETEGPLSETAVREILINILLVLSYIHSKGSTHRDIKPDNIILRHSNEKPVLIDFAAVKETMTTVVSAKGKASPALVVGTPGFMSPEQATGRVYYTSDLYSLGITAIYLLTGRLPQELEISQNQEQILWQQHALDVSKGLAAVIDKAIQYRHCDRYASARTMMLDILGSTGSVLRSGQVTHPTIDISPDREETSSKPASISSSQPAVFVDRSPRDWQKNLILGSLIAFGLSGAAAFISLVSNQPVPQLTVTSESPPPNLTPRTKSTPTPASSEPILQPATPTVRSAPRKAPNRQKSANRAAKNSVPGFPTGTSELRVKAALGNPTKTFRGYWPNTRAVMYDLKRDQITLGYLFDRTSGQLRQTEVAFGQSVKPDAMRTTLQKMLGVNIDAQKPNRAFVKVSQALHQVHQRRTDKYSFRISELEGAIERDKRDRIYIGVWEADLH